jgi:preprotein translocase subunit YajC
MPCEACLPETFRIINFIFSGVFPVFLISDAHAQTAAAHAAGSGGEMFSSLRGLLPLIVVFVVFFWFMIRPQMKKQKEHNAMITALAKGDEVAISGGLLGKVTGLSETNISLQIASGVEVQVQRGAVVQVLPKGTLKIKE